MARQARLSIAGAPHHVVQPSVAGQTLFADDIDAQHFLEAMRHAGRESRVSVHAYALTPERIQLLVTPAAADGVTRLMQRLGRRYVRDFNARHGRSGALFAGRFRSSVVDADGFLLACMHYIEDAPVAAGLAVIATDYRWSSARHHVGVESEPAISDHALYWRLGNTPFEREAAYRARLQQNLPAPVRQAIAAATQQGWPLGSAAFLSQLSQLTGRRTAPLPRGRRPKLAQR